MPKGGKLEAKANGPTHHLSFQKIFVFLAFLLIQNPLDSKEDLLL
jgi:hypothetical protein